MNYLFFDIECANCDNGNGKICSFGYVLTDTDFNILEYTDLIIDPTIVIKLDRAAIGVCKIVNILRLYHSLLIFAPVATRCQNGERHREQEK